MCGINGIYSKRQISEIEIRIQKMNQAIAHRGPDADCIKVLSENIGFGHRRLAIIDLDSRSEQPMKSNSGNSIIVFNGEIFNFISIRTELSNEYQFKTESDTEVLLAAFELRGIEWLLSKINGMFSFAIFDLMSNELYLVRDRFGIKPLFYTVTDDTLIFSSEIKGILSSGLVNAVFNETAVDDYLGYRYVREPFTFFQNVFQLESATYLHISCDFTIEKKKYWQLPQLNFETKFNEAEILKETDHQVVSAVNRWIISDVKVGAYLSGGVDSSLTTAILSNFLGNNLDTYTIGFSDMSFNEFEFAQKVAKLYKTNHREFLLNQNNYFEEWNRLIQFKDAPLSVPNEIPLAIMSTNLSSDITVVISGEGADELFGGYGRIFRSAFEFSNITSLRSSFYDFFISKYEYVPRSIRDKYLNTPDNYREHFDLRIASEFSRYSNEENIFRFFHNYHIMGLLNRVDMTTMQASVEARPPFLDHKLVEFVYTKIPYSLKLKWKSSSDMERAKKLSANEFSEVLDTPKYILKRVAESYLPKEVIYRKKMGFPVPLSNWFPKLEAISFDMLKDISWLKQELILELCNEMKNSNSERSGQLLWMFLNVEIFRKMYFSKNWKW
ncbi:MAG TPA: asparagine synthase (glutamine-hydrolyzing) [Edaphocola sp.]|nr:asparagine synthase (glutamine-hydrolyzing) [Edaphocola sp.]